MSDKTFSYFKGVVHIQTFICSQKQIEKKHTIYTQKMWNFTKYEGVHAFICMRIRIATRHCFASWPYSMQECNHPRHLFIGELESCAAHKVILTITFSTRIRGEEFIACSTYFMDDLQHSNDWQEGRVWIENICIYDNRMILSSR